MLHCCRGVYGAFRIDEKNEDIPVPTVFDGCSESLEGLVPTTTSNDARHSSQIRNSLAVFGETISALSFNRGLISSALNEY